MPGLQTAHFFSYGHPLLVHFPIVLLLLAVVVDIVAWRAGASRAPSRTDLGPAASASVEAARPDPEERLAWCGYWLTLVGTFFAVLAFVCGILAELYAARDGVPQDPIELHEWLATFATWLFLGLAVARILLGVTPARKFMPYYLLAGTVGCVLIGFAAHFGGQVVYGYGANVGGVRLERLMSDEDLAVLAQHQDEDTLQYSNQMHWIFGGVVIVLALSVLLERLPLGRIREIRRLMPVMFVGAGIYLAIWSDWDSWPISKLRPLTDPEVLLHKFLAIALVVMGLASMRRPSNPEAAPSAWQNRVIAVMAAIGGGLLFTHVHTNAPYTNVAVGVYLNHTAMGIASFMVAAAVLLADLFPGSRRIMLLFPLALLIEGVLLASYNEDLPWFLGYHRILNRAAHGGVLAHVPSGRAELTFDKDSGAMDIYFMGSHDDKPVALGAARLEGNVRARQQLFPIAFDRVAPGHYASRLAWLRTVPVFNLGLTEPVDTWFDPVVTAPLLPPLPGAEKVWACPMCKDVLSAIPGRCNMCGMTLVQLEHPVVYAPRLPPHDPGYAMKMDVTPSHPSAGRPARLVFTMTGPDGKGVKDFRWMHEKLMHTVVVRSDLLSFEHVHPIHQADGTFVLDHVFPSGGSFVVFSEAAPEGERSQRFRFPVEVAGPPPGSLPRVVRSNVEQLGEYTVALDTGELPLGHTWESQLNYTIFKNGRPVDDLGTYLGAAGHCVIISQDTQDYVHCHALQLTAALTPCGPHVAFHALFPRAGRYRIFAQFSHLGRVLTTDFGVEVR
jgi:uncharacterized membrane protein